MCALSCFWLLATAPSVRSWGTGLVSRSRCLAKCGTAVTSDVKGPYSRIPALPGLHTLLSYCGVPSSTELWSVQNTWARSVRRHRPVTLFRRGGSANERASWRVCARPCTPHSTTCPSRTAGVQKPNRRRGHVAVRPEYSVARRGAKL